MQHSQVMLVKWYHVSVLPQASYMVQAEHVLHPETWLRTPWLLHGTCRKAILRLRTRSTMHRVHTCRRVSQWSCRIQESLLRAVRKLCQHLRSAAEGRDCAEEGYFAGAPCGKGQREEYQGIRKKRINTHLSFFVDSVMNQFGNSIIQNHRHSAK